MKNMLKAKQILAVKLQFPIFRFFSKFLRDFLNSNRICICKIEFVNRIFSQIKRNFSTQIDLSLRLSLRNEKFAKKFLNSNRFVEVLQKLHS